MDRGHYLKRETPPTEIINILSLLSFSFKIKPVGPKFWETSWNKSGTGKKTRGKFDRCVTLGRFRKIFLPTRTVGCSS
ncbi:unnamed protein product [Tenebrio molitor]|nr:unnamed protein product [Tenebrio molitor]